MAFINGTIKFYHCPECQENLTTVIKTKPLRYEYKHSIYGMVMQNGYPSPCTNNGKTLEEKDVQILEVPNIIKDKITMSY